MDCSMPGFPVHHQLLELAQTHAHWACSDSCNAFSPSVIHYYPVCWNSRPFSWWCHLTISSSTAHFSCLQSLQASGSFPMSWLFTSSGQSIGASASAIALEYSGLISFRYDWLIFLKSKGLSRVFSSTKIQKHQFFGTQPSLWSNSHIRTWLLENPQLWLDGPCQQSDVSAF